MADVKSMQTLQAELKTFTRAKNRALDVSDNSLVNDIVFTPYAIGGKAVMDQVTVVKNLAKLYELEGDDLNNEGSNYNLERLTGSYATVTLTLYAANRPTATVSVPSSTQFRTAGTSFVSPVTYTVDNEYTFALADMDSYYNHDRGRYEFSVTATCDSLGTGGNVSANLINGLVGSVSQINGVTNLTAAINGLDEEEDDEYRERIRLAMIGRCLNVSNGLRGHLMGLGFRDANIVRVEETGYERATGVDAFVIDPSSSSATDTFSYDPSRQRYYLTYRPALSVTSVTAETVGSLTASQYSSNIDSTSGLRRSIYAQDYVTILPAAGLTTGTSFSVTYNYASSTYQAQAGMDQATARVLTADLLVKRAYPLYLFISATLTLKANSDGPTVRSKARNAMSQYLSRYSLGEDIQKSDLVVVLQEGYGDYPIESVDAVVISSYYLVDEYSTSYQPTDEVISVGDKQYVLYGSATVV